MAGIKKDSRREEKQQRRRISVEDQVLPLLGLAREALTALNTLQSVSIYFRRSKNNFLEVFFIWAKQEKYLGNHWIKETSGLPTPYLAGIAN